MNVMARAHELTKRRRNAKLLNGIKPAPYKVFFAKALKEAHQEYKAMTITTDQQKQATIFHLEDVIAKTLVHFEKLGVNDYYIAVENNKETQDYTLLQHKDTSNKSSPLGWAGYGTAIVTTPKQADEYVKAYPGVCKLHAQTHLSNVLDHFRKLLDEVK